MRKIDSYQQSLHDYKINNPALAAIIAIDRILAPISKQLYPVRLRILQASQPVIP